MYQPISRGTEGNAKSPGRRTLSLKRNSAHEEPENIVPKRKPAHEEPEKIVLKSKKPEPLYDPIFFRKADLRVGAELLYKGRLSPDTHWKIVRIMSDRGIGRGMKSVPEVNKLSDHITVQNAAGDSRTMSFAYASYSAIWQLPRNSQN